MLDITGRRDAHKAPHHFSETKENGKKNGRARARAREKKLRSLWSGISWVSPFFLSRYLAEVFFLAALFVFHSAIDRIEFQNLDLLFAIIVCHPSDLLRREPYP